jgi:hypothetical protein
MAATALDIISPMRNSKQKKKEGRKERRKEGRKERRKTKDLLVQISCSEGETFLGNLPAGPMDG